MLRVIKEQKAAAVLLDQLVHKVPLEVKDQLVPKEAKETVVLLALLDQLVHKVAYWLYIAYVPVYGFE